MKSNWKKTLLNVPTYLKKADPDSTRMGIGDSPCPKKLILGDVFDCAIGK
jgi:hypothetical protein